jgi:hypothetical protein
MILQKGPPPMLQDPKVSGMGRTHDGGINRHWAGKQNQDKKGWSMEQENFP